MTYKETIILLKVFIKQFAVKADGTYENDCSVEAKKWLL